MPILTLWHEVCPADSHDFSTRVVSIGAGAKLSETLTVILKKLSSRGTDGKLVYVDGRLTQRVDPT
jgi:hypothetical protein